MSISASFSQFPSLTTQRLYLREIRIDDAEALFAIKSDPEVTRHYGQEPHRKLDDTLGWIRRLQADYERREALFWALTLQGDEKTIGGIVFWNIDPGFHCAEIGYELHPSYWQQGLMSEGMKAVLAYGFTELGLNRIEAAPLAENKPSWNFLGKLGFSYEGNLRQRHFFQGRFIDQLYFGLLKEEWQKTA